MLNMLNILPSCIVSGLIGLRSCLEYGDTAKSCPTLLSLLADGLSTSPAVFLFVRFLSRRVFGIGRNVRCLGQRKIDDTSVAYMFG